MTDNDDGSGFSQNAQRQDDSPLPISGLSPGLKPKLNTPPPRGRLLPTTIASVSPQHSRLKQLINEISRETTEPIQQPDFKEDSDEDDGNDDQRMLSKFPGGADDPSPRDSVPVLQASSTSTELDIKMDDGSGIIDAKASKDKFRINSRYIHATYSGVLAQVERAMPDSSMVDIIHFAADNFGTARQMCQLLTQTLVAKSIYVDFVCGVRQTHVYSSVPGDYHYHMFAYLRKRHHTTNLDWVKLKDILKPYLTSYDKQV